MQLLTIFKAENVGISFNLIIESFQEITELFWKYNSSPSYHLYFEKKIC